MNERVKGWTTKQGQASADAGGRVCGEGARLGEYERIQADADRDITNRSRGLNWVQRSIRSWAFG